MNRAAAPSFGASPRRVIAGALAIAVLGTVIGPRPAAATTADGTIITNLVCATLNSVSMVPGVGWAGDPTSDPIPWSQCATMYVIVQSPNILLQKICNPTTSAAGGTVTCTMCVSNINPYMGAFNVKITDKIPANMGWIGARPNAEDWGGPWTYEVSATGAPASWFAGDPPAGQVTPYYLRWTRGTTLAPGASACVSFTLSIL